MNLFLEISYIFKRVLTYLFTGSSVIYSVASFQLRKKSICILSLMKPIFLSLVVRIPCSGYLFFVSAKQLILMAHHLFCEPQPLEV